MPREKVEVKTPEKPSEVKTEKPVVAPEAVTITHVPPVNTDGFNV